MKIGLSCLIVVAHTHFHNLSSHALFQMEEEARQRAQDALELARRHEEEEAMRRAGAGILQQLFRRRCILISLQQYRRRFQKRKSRLRGTSFCAKNKRMLCLRNLVVFGWNAAGLQPSLLLRLVILSEFLALLLVTSTAIFLLLQNAALAIMIVAVGNQRISRRVATLGQEGRRVSDLQHAAPAAKISS
jgi:hypothetical protein